MSLLQYKHVANVICNSFRLAIVVYSHNFHHTIMSLYGSLYLVWQDTRTMHIWWRWLLTVWYLNAVCSFSLYCSLMPSQKLLYALRNCFSSKLEQILTTCISSKHTLLYNLYNSIDVLLYLFLHLLHSMYRFNNNLNSVPSCMMVYTCN